MSIQLTGQALSQMKSFDPDIGLISREQSSISNPGNSSTADAKGVGFMDVLAKSMEEVNVSQVGADQAIKDLIAGKSKNLHETMLAVQKAELSLKTMMQVRNKVLEAYKEIMRMQV
jgi:flagellar hook-basal body complex protein FliE